VDDRLLSILTDWTGYKLCEERTSYKSLSSPINYEFHVNSSINFVVNFCFIYRLSK